MMAVLGWRWRLLSLSLFSVVSSFLLRIIQNAPSVWMRSDIWWFKIRTHYNSKVQKKMSMSWLKLALEHFPQEKLSSFPSSSLICASTHSRVDLCQVVLYSNEGVFSILDTKKCLHFRSIFWKCCDNDRESRRKSNYFLHFFFYDVLSLLLLSSTLENTQDCWLYRLSKCFNMLPCCHLQRNKIHKGSSDVSRGINFDQRIHIRAE